ncbi:MAG TPA: hypothetical protein VIG06_06580 [Kofleriaceae bacterium]
MTRPLIKKPGQPGGFVPIPYPNALQVAAERFDQIRQIYGDDAIALVGEGPAPTAISVETEVVLVAGSTLGGVVRLLVESGSFDVELISQGGIAGVTDAPLRRIGSARELVRAINAGEVKGLVSISFDPPAGVRLAPALDALEFHLAIDSVLGRVARHADIVLPLTRARAADAPLDRDATP